MARMSYDAIYAAKAGYKKRTLSVESLDVRKQSEVRLELLRPMLYLLGPTSHLRMCFYWTRRVARALESICGICLTCFSDQNFKLMVL